MFNFIPIHYIIHFYTFTNLYSFSCIFLVSLFWCYGVYWFLCCKHCLYDGNKWLCMCLKVAYRHPVKHVVRASSLTMSALPTSYNPQLHHLIFMRYMQHTLSSLPMSALTILGSGNLPVPNINI